MSDAEVDARFDALQRKLVPLWKSIQTFTQDPQTIVVVPSITIDSTIRGARQQAYEERFLFLLLLLRQPRARLIYVTSQAIHPDVVDYYLDLLPGVLASHAKKRLFLVSPLDGSSRPLTQKLLERPRLIQHIRSLIPDPDRAHLVPYNTTTLERDLALALGIPMYGADPKHSSLGTKSGARRIFAEEGVPHPLGVEDLHSAADLADAIVEMRARKPSHRQGRREAQRRRVRRRQRASRSRRPVRECRPSVDAVAERLQALRFESSEMTFDAYIAKLAERGGIVEERIAGSDFRSPSAQLRVTPLGKVEALSTHDQVLGGPSGQSYLGCRFPANAEYAPAIMREAHEGRPPADAGRRARALRARLRHGAQRARTVGGLRDRDQPAEGRHHASRS